MNIRSNSRRNIPESTEEILVKGKVKDERMKKKEEEEKKEESRRGKKRGKQKRKEGKGEIKIETEREVKRESKIKSRISGRGRFKLVRDLERVIDDYFKGDAQFQANKKKNMKHVFREKVLGLNLQNEVKEVSSDVLGERAGLRILPLTVAAEKTRTPLLLHIQKLPRIDTALLVEDLDVSKTKTVESFAHGKVTLQELVHGYDKRWKNPTKYPISVVADMTEYKAGSAMEHLVKVLNESWNLFYRASLKIDLHLGLANLQEPSLVVSDYGAVSTNHFHPWMFLNIAFSGVKGYLLFDVEEADAKFTTKVHQLKNIDIRTGRSARGANKYKDILNARISRRLTFSEFMSLTRSYFAIISSESTRKEPTVANFILVPSRYAHEVYTLGTGTSEIYGGLSGFGLPDAPSIYKTKNNIQLLANSTSETPKQKRMRGWRQ